MSGIRNNGSIHNDYIRSNTPSPGSDRGAGYGLSEGWMLDEHVLVLDGRQGIIRYIGIIEGADHAMYGVQMKDPSNTIYIHSFIPLQWKFFVSFTFVDCHYVNLSCVISFFLFVLLCSW